MTAQQSREQILGEAFTLLRPGDWIQEVSPDARDDSCLPRHAVHRVIHSRAARVGYLESRAVEIMLEEGVLERRRDLMAFRPSYKLSPAAELILEGIEED